MYFDNFVATFNAPTSTTKQLEVAAIFSDDNKGLVLELEECGSTRNKKLCYFDCSLISCYGYEDEKLFFGGIYFLQFRSIHLMTERQDLRYFIKALTLFGKVLNGWYLQWSIRESIKKVDYRIIKKLISKRINFQCIFRSVSIDFVMD